MVGFPHCALVTPSSEENPPPPKKIQQVSSLAPKFARSESRCCCNAGWTWNKEQRRCQDLDEGNEESHDACGSRRIFGRFDGAVSLAWSVQEVAIGALWRMLQGQSAGFSLCFQRHPLVPLFNAT